MQEIYNGKRGVDELVPFSCIYGTVENLHPISVLFLLIFKVEEGDTYDAEVACKNIVPNLKKLINNGSYITKCGNMGEIELSHFIFTLDYAKDKESLLDLIAEQKDMEGDNLFDLISKDFLSKSGTFAELDLNTRKLFINSMKPSSVKELEEKLPEKHSYYKDKIIEAINEYKPRTILTGTQILNETSLMQ